MRWEARGVAARLCGVGRPTADRTRRPFRQVLLGGPSGGTGRKKRDPAGALSERHGAERRDDTQACPSSASFLPDLVPCAQVGRKLKRTVAAPTGADRTVRIDVDQADDSASVTPGGAPSMSVSKSRRMRPKIRSPALLTGINTGSSSSKGKLMPPTVPTKNNHDENSGIQSVHTPKKNAISGEEKPTIRRMKLYSASPGSSLRKIKLPRPLSSSDSEYVQMRPKIMPRKPEYVNIDSCASSRAGDDSGASSGELPDPARNLPVMFSALRIQSDKGSRSLSSNAPRKSSRSTLLTDKTAKRSMLPGITATSVLKEKSEHSRRKRARRSSERSLSAGDCDQSMSQGSEERDSSSRSHRSKLASPTEFGYDIDNVSSFLSQATARTPANIPMVVTSCTELYLLSPAAAPKRTTITVQLGIVVNALFKRRQWLYVQTPHSQEGYIAYSACSALGVIPRRTTASPWDWQQAAELQPSQPPARERSWSPPPARERSWSPPPARERSWSPPPARKRSWSPPLTSLPAPDPRRNKTDTQKMYENVTSDGRALGLLVQQHVRQQRIQHRVRRAHLHLQPHSARPASSAFRRLQTQEVAPSRGKLQAPPRGRVVAPRTNNKAVIWDGFTSFGRNTLTVKRGDIVILLNTSVGDWFWVKDSDGHEGYIPAVCVGSGLT